MELVLVAAILLVLLFAVIVWLTVSLLGLLITLLIAGFVGWLAGKVLPGRLPLGWLGAILAGLIGSWIGGALLGDLGPAIGGISLIPAFAGAVLLAFLAGLVLKPNDRARRRSRRRWG